ncbi:hypothetical protein [Actinoplanes sp. HUAS TT8]|uniref:hypothetical protein n=1 Tax=Actinoplanes sp. HUAS TT8 TaxID=3447453 RepID=UPI003F52737F
MGLRRTAGDQRATPAVTPAATPARPHTMTATDQVLRLQRLAGNRAVTTMLAQRVLATATPGTALREYGPDDFTFIKEFKGGSSQPWHVEVGGVGKVFKFVRRRDRTTVRPPGVPGVPDAAEQAALDADQIAPEDVMRTEMLTGQLYQAAGAKVLPAELAWVATSIGGRPQWSLAQIADFRADAQEPSTEELAASPDFRRDLGLDAVLAIFDLHKPANWLKTGDGMIRQDLGGAMHVRAQGGRKPDGDFLTGTDLPKTIIGMGRNKESPYHGLNLAELAESLISLRRRLPQARIVELVTASGLPERDQTDLIRTLDTRINEGVAWAMSRNAEEVPVTFDQGTRPGVAGADPTLDTYGGPDVVEGFRSNATTVGGLVAELTMMLGKVGEQRLPARERTIGQLRRFLATGPAGVLAEPEKLGAFTAALTGWIPAERELRIIPVLLQTLEAQVILVRGTAQETWNVDPDAAGRNDDPYATPPMVGPEELLNITQYTPAKRADFVAGLQRLQGSVLIRRLAQAEENAFKAAAAAGDVDGALTALFTAGKRGEIVFSVNDAYIFDREIDDLKDANWKQLKPKKGYERIVEIPVTAGMLAFLRDYSYISNPETGSAKLSPFKGSPNVKFEGSAGGARDGDGIPNVVVKRQGFAQFWAAAEAVRFFDATGYSGIDRSIARAKRLAGGDGPVQDESAQAKARRDARTAKKKGKEKAGPEDTEDFGLGGFF